MALAAHEYDQIRRLCHDQDTVDLAVEICRKAKTRTQPGSGFSLWSTAAIPAICAYMASTKLGNNLISRDSAQTVSCLNKQKFDQDLRTVMNVIEGDKAKGPHVSFDKLISEHGKPDGVEKLKLSHWLREVQRLLPGGGIKAAELCAVYFWVCNSWKPDFLDANQFCQIEDIELKQFQQLQKRISTKAGGLKTKMIEDMKKTVIPPRSPFKRSAPADLFLERSPKKPHRELPTNDRVTRSSALHEAASSSQTAQRELRPASPSKHIPPPPRAPVKQSMVSDSAPMTTAQSLGLGPKRTRELPSNSPRKAHSGTPAPEPATPIKPKLSFDLKVTFTPEDEPASPTKSAPPTKRASTSPRKMVTRSSRAAEKAAEEAMDVDEPQSSEEEKEAPVRRRYRPVFVDTLQWSRRDKRVVQMYKRGDAVRADLIAKHGYPQQLRVAAGL
ncbi:hypothetical protein FISHEDRAFT_56700 [Fistulina hepatica ATCC 64428]|uniref:Uncharacterized protein n=1 Tax=Fistulina hepatica ATCC 64428 TaxID=1128425 RepID=A0A0D7AJT1_9AGAR|nr:hypothetical protein FISHEDRAFT_56700 [Fistulina hepatica ATCC 64428]